MKSTLNPVLITGSIGLEAWCSSVAAPRTSKNCADPQHKISSNQVELFFIYKICERINGQDHTILSPSLRIHFIRTEETSWFLGRFDLDISLNFFLLLLGWD